MTSITPQNMDAGAGYRASSPARAFADSAEPTRAPASPPGPAIPAPVKAPVLAGQAVPDRRMDPPVNVNTIDVARGPDASPAGKGAQGAAPTDTGTNAPVDIATIDVATGPDAGDSVGAPVDVDTIDVAPGAGPGTDAPPAGPFLNGEKPKVAIVDNGFAEPDETFGTVDPGAPRSLAGHGAIVKDVIEQQLGVDGTRVDIDEFEVGESTDPTAVVETLEAVAASDTTYDYANLSVGLYGEPVLNLGTGLILSDYNAAAEANGTEGVAGGGAVTPETVAAGLDLTDGQKRDIVTFAIDAYGGPLQEGASATDRFKNDFGRAFAASVELMNKGTQVVHAGPGGADVFDPLSLLDGFNETTPGGFTTVQATNENVLENSFEFEDDPTAADRPIVPVTGGVEADATVGGRIYNQDFGIPIDVESSSFAAPEFIAETIKARLGGVDPLSNAERGAAIGPQDADSVFFTRPADPAA